MPTTTARRQRRLAMRVLYVAGPLSIITLVAWGFRLVPEERQPVVFMAYQLCQIVAGSAAIVAAVSHGQLGVARAFTAGYNTALRTVEEMNSQQRNGTNGAAHHRLPPPLRLVQPPPE